MTRPDTRAHGRLRAMGSGGVGLLRTPRPLRLPHLPQLLAVLCAVAIVLLAVSARPAFAYEMSRVSLSATVAEDGGLQVVEERTFAFDDDVNGVYWTIPITQNEQGGRSWPDVPSLEAAVVSGSAAEPLERTGAAEPGESGVFTVEEDDNVLRVQLFSPHADGDEATFRLSYRLTGAVMSWPDTAELYWQFIGSEWEEPSEGVTLEVTFAGAAASTQSTTDGGVRAWGHGPLEGDVKVDAETPSVRYTVPRVRDGEYAEARIVFPRGWVPGLKVPAGASSTERLPEVLEEEAAWAADVNARREQMRTIIDVGGVLQIALPAILLVAAVVLRLTRGRAPRTTFTEQYLRELPSSDHPAVIAAFMEGGEAGERAFAVTLMKLTDEGVVGIAADNRGEWPGATADNPDAAEPPAYRLRLLKPEVRDGSGIDAAALRVFFRGVRTESSFDELHAAAEAEPEATNELMDAFRAEVEEALAGRGLSAPIGAPRAAVLVTAVVLLAASGALAAYTDGATLGPLALGVLLLIAAALLMAHGQVATQAGVDLRARCEAFRRWIEDCTRLGESIDVERPEGRRMLVMATAVGVDDEVIAAFAARAAGPTEAAGRAGDAWLDGDAMGAGDDAVAYGYGGCWYPYPLFWWYHPWYGHDQSPRESMGAAYDDAASSIASSLSASADGGDGGFSSGGGGGVGGGGGGGTF